MEFKVGDRVRYISNRQEWKHLKDKIARIINIRGESEISPTLDVEYDEYIGNEGSCAERHGAKRGYALSLKTTDFELVLGDDDDSQFEDDFIDEEYNYKEKKFEVGDRIEVILDPAKNGNDSLNIFNLLGKTGTIVKFACRDIYMVKMDEPLKRLKNYITNVVFDEDNSYLKPIKDYYENNPDENVIFLWEKIINLIDEPEDDSQFEDDFENVNENLGLGMRNITKTIDKTFLEFGVNDNKFDYNYHFDYKPYNYEHHFYDHPNVIQLIIDRYVSRGEIKGVDLHLFPGGMDNHNIIFDKIEFFYEGKSEYIIVIVHLENKVKGSKKDFIFLFKSSFEVNNKLYILDENNIKEFDTLEDAIKNMLSELVTRDFDILEEEFIFGRKVQTEDLHRSTINNILDEIKSNLKLDKIKHKITYVPKNDGLKVNIILYPAISAQVQRILPSYEIFAKKENMLRNLKDELETKYNCQVDYSNNWRIPTSTTIGLDIKHISDATYKLGKDFDIFNEGNLFDKKMNQFRINLEEEIKKYFDDYGIKNYKIINARYVTFISDGNSSVSLDYNLVGFTDKHTIRITSPNNKEVRYFNNLEKAVKYTADLFVTKDFDIFESINNNYNELLLNSANDGDLNGVKKALKNGANINIQDKYGYTALIYASHYGYTRIAKYLIDNKANLDIQNNAGDTALIYASLNGHIEIAKYLIDNKANLDIQNKYGNTALIFANANGNTEIVKYLIDNDANMDIQNKYGNTALMWASANGRIEICKLIVTKILETQPYRAHELLKYLTDEQRQQYKEFIVANRDFDIFENMNTPRILQYKEYLKQILKESDLDIDFLFSDIKKDYRLLNTFAPMALKYHEELLDNLDDADKGFANIAKNPMAAPLIGAIAPYLIKMKFVVSFGDDQKHQLVCFASKKQIYYFIVKLVGKDVQLVAKSRNFRQAARQTIASIMTEDFDVFEAE